MNLTYTGEDFLSGNTKICKFQELHLPSPSSAKKK